MPFLRPTLTDLRRQALDDMTNAPGAEGMGLLRFAVSRVLAWAMAYLAHGQYGYLDWIARESVPFSATDEALVAWAALVGIPRKPAAAATGFWSGTGVPGTMLPVGSLLTRQDGAAFVTSDAGVVGADGTVVVPMLAVLAGAAGNCPDGTPFSLSQAFAGINAAGRAAGAVAQGAEMEGDDALRTRMLERWAEPPQGGSRDDYRRWALAVPGVTRAWIVPRGMGPGTVMVYTMWDGAEAAHGGFPQGTGGVAAREDRDLPATGDLLAVADALLLVQPVSDLVYSVAPLSEPTDFVIQTPAALTSAQQAAAAAALRAVFLMLADATGGVIPIGPFDTALQASLGSALFTVRQPSAPITTVVGHLPVLGNVLWQTGSG